MIKDDIEKIVKENNISDNAEMKAISMDDMIGIVLNILHSYSESMIDSLNMQTKMLRATCADSEETSMLNSMTELVNTMINKAIGDAIDSIMPNLGKFFGIEDLMIYSEEDELAELKNIEKCDGEA